MAILPIPSGVSRIARENADEIIGQEERRQNDAKLRQLQNTPMVQLGPDEPLPFDKLQRPDWMRKGGYDTPDPPPSTAAPTFAPAEDDPNRNYSALGQSPMLTRADFEGDPAPASYNQFGTGGPEGKGPLDEQVVVDILKKRAERQAAQSQAGIVSGLLQALGSPDQAAADLDLANKAGVTRAEAEQNRKSIQAGVSAKLIEESRQTAPRLYSWLDASRENLEIAHDDVQNLSLWEQLGSAFNPGSLTVEEVGGALRTGAVEGGTQQFYGATEMGIGIARMFEWLPGVKNLLDQGESAAKAERQKAAITAAMNMPQGDTVLERGIYGAAQSAPASVEAMVAAIITKNPAMGAITMGGATAGQSYGEAEDAGKDWTSRMRYALTQGGIEAATEFLPLKFIVGDLAKDTPFFKSLMKQAVSEGIGEQVATFTQDASSWLELHPEKTLGEFMAERPNAAMETLIASTLMTGVQTTLAHGMQAGADQLNQNAQQARADKLAKTFDAMAKGALDSKLAKRLPDKYREAVAQVTKDGPLESVRVAPEAIAELAQSANVTPEQLAQAFRIDPNDMNAAISAGEDVVIPAGNYAAALAGAKKELGISGEQIHTAFAPNMRLRADDFTAKEQAAMKAVFEEEQKARTEAGTKEQVFADSADRVRESIREQVTATGIWNTEAANTQATLIGEMVTTLAERTGQDPEALWKEQGFDIVAALTGEASDEGALSQGGDRAPIEVSDEIVNRASEQLTDYEFAVWKAAALEGRSNKDIADDPDIAELRTPVNGMQTDMLPSAVNVGAILVKVRAKGFEVGQAKRGRGDSIRDDVRRLMRQGLNARQIHTRLGRTDEQYNSTKAMVSKLKKEMREGALSQKDKARYSGQALEIPRIISLFEGANLSSLVHESAHWYLTTLERMARAPNPHPFVVAELAAIREWQGKSAEFQIYDDAGVITAEGREVHEAFAETFEVYLHEGKAPTVALRSVFASFKQWLMRLYKQVRGVWFQRNPKTGAFDQFANLDRANLNEEIKAVFDRMLATDEAINAATAGMERDGKAMAEAIIEKTGKEWSDERKAKFTERMTAKYAQAKEQAEADMMARLMDDYERNQKAWWRDEERQVRREVQSEVDERPEQRAYSWLTGKGWKDTREAHTEAAFTESEVMRALQQAPELGFFEANATDESLKALHQKMVDNGIVPVILLFKTSSGRVIAFPGDTGDFGFHHDLAREVFGLGDLQLQHGVYNPRRWPTIEAMNAAGAHAWYGTSGTQADTVEASPLQARRVQSLAQSGTENLLVYRGAGEGDLAGVGRLGSGVYLAEDPEIGAEWGGETGKVDAYRINGKLFDLDETTAQGIENYQKQENTPQAEALFTRLKAEGYVGVRDPWSGHINVFDAKDMQRVPSEDKELGTTWTNFVDDEEATSALAQTAFDLSTPEQRARWVANETVSSSIPGEATDAKQWGFVLDDGTGIVVSIAPDPNGEDVIEWTFLDRLKARESVSDLYKQGGPELTVSQIKQLLVRLAAIIETDMREGGRDAYAFTPATDAIGRINARLLKLIDTGPFAVLENYDNGSDVLILHKDADIDSYGRILPRPENENRHYEWDDGQDAEARQDAFYAKVEALARPIRPAATRSAGSGAVRTGSGTQGGDALAQSSSKLDMSEPARMERARADGFDTSKVLYHGSPNGKIEEMQRGTGYLGDGVYLTTDRKAAAGYKTQSGNERGVGPLTKATRTVTGKVYETFVRGKGISAEDYQALVNKLNLDAANGNIFAADPSQTRAKMIAQSQLSQQGITHVVDGDLVMVFNPKNVRQADAAFDHSQSGSGKLLAQEGDTKGRTAPPTNLPLMRLNLQAVKDQYGEQALKDLPPQVAAYSAQATDADQFLQVAHDVRKTLKQKKPKSLWKFLSTSRIIGSGNDKIAYRGIRDDGGEIMKIIGEKKAAPGLISDTEDAKKVRSYTIEHAANVAWEDGYFSGESPPTPAEFLDALRADFDGQAKLYARDEIGLVQEIKAAEQWEQWFDANDIDISEKDTAALRAKLETLLTGQGENAISPDEAAPFFNMPDGKALLEGLKQGPLRNKLIREETKRRMIATHGDIFNDGTMMVEAEKFARNEIIGRQFEIELDALARAGGQPAAANLAKQTAIENLRSKQVREVLNYEQWRILSDRWGKKALEAATKGDMEKAAEYARYRLINHHMFIEGRKLGDKVEKARKHLLDYGKKPKQARLFAAGKDYQDQMNGLLDDYQLRPESRKKESQRLARGEWIKAQMASIDPFAAYQDTTKSPQEQQVAAAEALERSRVLSKLAEGTEAQNFKSITVEELLSVRDEADMIWKLATLKDKLIKEGERRRLSLAAEDISAEIITNQPKEKPPEPIETDAPGEKAKRGVLKYFAMHRTLQSLAHQFAGGKDGGVFWSYIVKPLNAAYAHLSDLRKQMGSELDNLFSAYSKEERARFYKDRQHFASLGVSLTKQGRLAVALNWGNEKNRQRLMDSTGWSEAGIQEVLDTLDKRDWDFLQATWDYLDTWFPEANRVHEAIHGAPMDKVQPLPIATRFGIYKGGYYPIAFDPELSSKSGQRKMEADAKQMSGRIGVRSAPGFSKQRVEGKVTLPLKLSVFDVITRHLDQVATSIATEETLFDVGRLIRHSEVEDAIVKHHGRQVYNTIVNTLVTTKFGMEGTSGILAHLRNGATVVGLGWKVTTALLQPLGITNSIVRVGGYWMAKGYARMGKDAATIQSSADWIMERSEFMRHRREAQSPELAALKDKIKKGGIMPRWLTHSMFALMSNVQYYSVDMPTWYGGYYKAKAAGLEDGEAFAQADQAVIDAQGGGELHQTAAIQTGAGTKYAAALRLLTNFMSYMVTTYNLATQRARNANTTLKMAALSFDLILILAIPVAGKMMLDAWTKGGGGDDDDLWEKYAREQAAFLMSPFVGLSQIAGAARGDDAFSYRGPAGLGIFGEMTNAGKALAELDLDESFWRPANKAAGMMLHYPAAQADLTFRGALALWNGETQDPGVLFFGPKAN